MASMIAVRVPSQVVAAPESPDEAVAPACAIGGRGWLAVDVDAEQKIEARIQRKMTFKEHLFTWLVDYNRH